MIACWLTRTRLAAAVDAGAAGSLPTTLRCRCSIPRRYTWLFHGSQAWKSHGINVELGAPKLTLFRESLQPPRRRVARRQRRLFALPNFGVGQLSDVFKPVLAASCVVDSWGVALEENRTVF